MEYVIADMRWTTLLNNKQLDYMVHQMGAIRIDENLHTVESFHRLNALDYKMAKLIAYTMDEEEDIIVDLETAWEQFKDWLPKDAVLLVWNKDIAHVIARLNKQFRKRPLNVQIIDLCELQEVLYPYGTIPRSLEQTMKELKLTCKSSYMVSAFYRAQCLLRLYRKLWKEAMKHIEGQKWDLLVSGRNYEELKALNLFVEQSGKQISVAYKEEIESFCKEKHFTLDRKGAQITIETFRATWTFDLNNRGTDLMYIPKRYVQIPRKDMRLKKECEGGQERDGKVILKEIFDRIMATEERLQYGVGSVELEKVIVEVGRGLEMNLNKAAMKL